MRPSNWTKELEEMDWNWIDENPDSFGFGLTIPLDIGPKNCPQEGQLEKDAVDFDKGCYFGPGSHGTNTCNGSSSADKLIQLSWTEKKFLPSPAI